MGILELTLLTQKRTQAVQLRHAERVALTAIIERCVHPPLTAWVLTMPPFRPKPKRDFGFNTSADAARLLGGDRACLLTTPKPFVPSRGVK